MYPMKNISDEIKMEIRKTTFADLERVMEIYALAREFMVRTGNPDQWKTHKPQRALIEKDIDAGQSYVCTVGDKIIGVLAFIPGEDPTYKVIYDGEWRSDEPYAVVHRIASSGEVKGTGTFMMKWAESRFPHIRIDTHKDNKVMQNMLSKLGYSYCGIIHLEDGDERLAYEK